jgi:hypothetical protein
MDVFVCMMGALILMFVVISYATSEEPETFPSEGDSAERFARQRSVLIEQIANLRARRTSAVTRLTEKRAEIGELEDDARRVADELDRAHRFAGDISRTERSSESTNAKLRERLTSYDAELDAEENALKQALTQVRMDRRTYAVLPHDGPNATRRRPMYVECRAEAVVLQPEGIVLEESDFIGPIGPENALASALRAGCEHLERRHKGDDNGAPYPLLLVRPDGIQAYYMAREALRRWTDDFGYELIEQDWELAFDAASPALAAAMCRAIEEARRRQLLVVAAAPRLASAEQRHALQSAMASRGQEMLSDCTDSSRFAGTADARFINSAERQSLDRAASLAPYSQLPVDQSSSNRSPSQINTWLTAGKTYSKPLPRQTTTSEADHETSATRSDAAKQLAELGKKSRGTGIPITRPIAMRCDRDRLLLLPEKGDARDIDAILLSDRAINALAPLVHQLRERIDSWGIAGEGMFWRPMLVVSVSLGAEDRFEELRALLADSGLEMHIKNGISPRQSNR